MKLQDFLVSVQEELNIWYLHYQDFLQDLPVLYFCHEQIPVWVMQGLGYEFKVITCVVLGGVSVAGRFR